MVSALALEYKDLVERPYWALTVVAVWIFWYIFSGPLGEKVKKGPGKPVVDVSGELFLRFWRRTGLEVLASRIHLFLGLTKSGSRVDSYLTSVLGLGAAVRLDFNSPESKARIEDTDECHIDGTFSWPQILAGLSVPRNQEKMVVDAICAITPGLKIICLIGHSRTGKSVLARCALHRAARLFESMGPSPLMLELVRVNDPAVWERLPAVVGELERPVIALADDAFDELPVIAQFRSLMGRTIGGSLTLVLTIQPGLWEAAEIPESTRVTRVFVTAPDEAEKTKFLNLIAPEANADSHSLAALLRNPRVQFCDLFQHVKGSAVERHHTRLAGLVAGLGESVERAVALLAFAGQFDLGVPENLIRKIAGRDLVAMPILREMVTVDERKKDRLRYVGHAFHAQCAAIYAARRGLTSEILIGAALDAADSSEAAQRTFFALIFGAAKSDTKVRKISDGVKAQELCRKCATVSELITWWQFFRRTNDDVGRIDCEVRGLTLPGADNYERSHQIRWLIERPNNIAQANTYIDSLEQSLDRGDFDTWIQLFSLLDRFPPKDWSPILARAEEWLDSHQEDFCFRARYLSTVCSLRLPNAKNLAVLRGVMKWMQRPGDLPRGNMCGAAYPLLGRIRAEYPDENRRFLADVRRLQLTYGGDLMLRYSWQNMLRTFAPWKDIELELGESLLRLERTQMDPEGRGHLCVSLFRLSESDPTGESPKRLVGNVCNWAAKGWLVDSSYRIRALAFIDEHGTADHRTAFWRLVVNWLSADWTPELALALLHSLSEDQPPDRHLAEIEKAHLRSPNHLGLLAFYLDTCSRTQTPNLDERYANALLEHPADSTLIVSYVRHLLRKGDNEAALRVLFDSPEKFRGCRHATMAFARVFFSNRQWAEAREKCNHLIFATPVTDSVGCQAFRYRAMISLIEGLFVDSDLYISRAIKAAKNYRARRREATMAQAWLRLAQGRTTDAFVCFTNASHLYWNTNGFLGNMFLELPRDWVRQTIGARRDEIAREGSIIENKQIADRLLSWLN